MYSVQCTLYNTQYIVYSVQCIYWWGDVNWSYKLARWRRPMQHVPVWLLKRIIKCSMYDVQCIFTIHDVYVCTLYNVHCTQICIVYREYTLYTVHCTVYSVHCKKDNMHWPVYTVLSTLYIVENYTTLHIVHCIVYIIHCIIPHVYCIQCRFIMYIMKNVVNHFADYKLQIHQVLITTI